MGTIIEDALGFPLSRGDWVAHISRQGSATKITHRQITDLGWEHSPYLYDGDNVEPYLCLDGNRNHVMPYNCVKVEAPND